VSRFRAIVVPLDFSDTSHDALELAIEIAKPAGAVLHLLHAYELPLGAIPPYGVTIPESVLVEVRDAASRRLEKAVHRAEAAGVRCETHLFHGAPAEAIVEEAARLGADLVVMGTRGLTGFKHVLLGSVAERTVRLAPCPVLTVGPRAHTGA
jgi:nucleotide-binding universal stress UspA family protein